jgi:hypothetical protein
MPHLSAVGISGLQAGEDVKPHESYRLVYEIDRDAVWVLALLHTSRQWPPVKD